MNLVHRYIKLHIFSRKIKQNDHDYDSEKEEKIRRSTKYLRPRRDETIILEYTE